MLLIIYCLFRPRKGDIWKLLDYACRLCLELGFHREPDIAMPLAQQEQQRYTFWSLYSIERIIGQLFGRPSDLPESMISTELPIVLSIPQSVHDVELHTLVQTRHHYQLVYLRSSIFSDMYLAEHVHGQRPLSWYQDKLRPILDWYRRSKSDLSTSTTVASLTCTVAFHSTILFVFQPLVLEALAYKNTSKPSQSKVAQTAFNVPAEIFKSATCLVEIYEEILMAHRKTILGSYPITFMSAHYIFTASMMILAYCILSMDDDMVFQSVIDGACPEFIEETAHIHLDDVLRISNSCLMLLAFCAEKWPGMEGMRDTFRGLSDQVIGRRLRTSLGKTAAGLTQSTIGALSVVEEV
jgi:hypothetical protein